MTDNSLDSILSGAGASAPVSEPERIVDEPEQLITEQGEGRPSPVETDDPADPAEPKGRNPAGAIRKDEREKANRRYTEVVSDFERKLEEQNKAWEARLAQMMQVVGQRQQPEPKPQAEPRNLIDTLLEDPRAAIRGEVEPLFEQVQRQLMANAEIVARQVHGADKVAEAEAAFLEAYRSGRLDPADYHRVVNSPNRWDAAAQWHKRTSALSEIGDDPAAFRERMRAEILAEIKQAGRLPDAAPSRQSPAAIGTMPSNFAEVRNAGTRTDGVGAQDPPSFSDILTSKRQAFRQ